ncbi:hypothetical protein CTheo_3075 [Ceratobasidium theobromae]|uniref:Uncharacterized protein n=1 Tax=Ceratobasidium theobromae TaxID=1582974 RepID=A0A5N5QPI2_9AGAM|nr:hypothetical protein CTheo_3075 [Ceratobasidium theobromae]
MSNYAAPTGTASTASLITHPQTRDYSAAFGALASSYGASGSAPCRPSSKTTSHLNTGPLSSQRSSGSKASPSPRAQSSKYAVPKSQDFGALMNKYGTGAGPIGSLL